MIALFSTIEPKIIYEAPSEDSWVTSMEKKLSQFSKNKEMNPCSKTRLEAIRIFLAYVAHKDIKLYQMDAKSVFLKGFTNEEVYVKQPPKFDDKEKP